MPSAKQPPSGSALGGPPREKRVRQRPGDAKEVLTFRCTKQFDKEIRGDAASLGMTVTEYIIMCLRIVRDFYGLPDEQANALRRERAALGMTAFDYMHYANFMRGLNVRRKGPGYDLPPSDKSDLLGKGGGSGG